MSKKIKAALVIIVLLFFLSALSECGSNDQQSTSEQQSASVSQNNEQPNQEIEVNGEVDKNVADVEDATEDTPEVIDLANEGAVISGVRANYKYTGQKITPSVQVELNDKKLKRDTDYTVRYSDNKKIGYATIAVTGKGNYSGSIEDSFGIVPKRGKIKGLSAKTNRITVKWEKQKGASDAIIEYSEYKDFALSDMIEAYATDSKAVIKGLFSGTRYYVRVKVGMSEVEGFEGKWSSKKSIKTKSKKKKKKTHASTAAADPTVFITASGKKYHLESCHTINGSSTKSAISQSSAINQGYEACRVCNP